MVLCLFALVFALPAAVRAHTNFLMILGDDTGWGDVGWNADLALHPPAGGGNYTPNPPRTPHLDSWAKAPGSIVFDRFYSGNPVCSPTRAALLSGRTPFRDCIEGANEQQPFPAVTPTVAQQALDKGYRTLFIGKWHLGCLYGGCLDWELGPRDTPAVHKWRSANPGNLGFSEYHATIAVTPTSTTNCGCSSEWAREGCIAGGGMYVNHTIHNTSGAFFDKGMSEGKGYFYTAEDCQTFWRPSPEAGAYCGDPTRMDRACVANYTHKIPGDLTRFDVGLFEEFLQRNESAPFLAYIALSTNHVPHYALPEWYHAYTDELGRPAGDYLGSLSQMDDSLGVLRSVLRKYGVENNTLVWFSTDNGAHTLADPNSLNPAASARSGGQLAASNGLRQCKASVFEGGIRVPAFIHWPAVIGSATPSRHSSHVSSSLDFMATVNEIIGAQYPAAKANWTIDSKSLLPLLDGRQPLDSARDKPLGWQYQGQVAVTNQTGNDTWKLVAHPAKGQCETMLPPYKNNMPGPFLFNLAHDETESHDLCASNPAQCDAMKQLMADYLAGVEASAKYESTCSVPK